MSMKDKRGVEITLSMVARYLNIPLNHRVFQLLRIEPVDDYILSDAQIEKISLDMYNSIKKNQLEIPSIFLINVKELNYKLEKELGINHRTLYYSPVTKMSYKYCGTNNWAKRNLDDFRFCFIMGTYKDYIIRSIMSDPFTYRWSKRLELSMLDVKKLQLYPQEGRYIDKGDCFYCDEIKQFVCYTCDDWNMLDYHFENPFHEKILLSNSQISNLIRVDIKNFFAIRAQDVSYICLNQDGNVVFYEKYVMGHYRGEDSGAIYPEYNERILCEYNLTKLFYDHDIDLSQNMNERISQLVEKCHSKDIYDLLYRYPDLCTNGVPLYDPPIVPQI